MLSKIHLFSIIITLLSVSAVGIYSFKRVKSADDFSGENKSITSSIVVGIVLGTMLGGSSTIATSQMAFEYGFSAMWFTLGSALACFFMALFLAKPLRLSGVNTIPEFLGNTYGQKASFFSSIFSSLGIFFNIIGQILCSIPILTSIFSISLTEAAFLSVILVICYVVFGGVWGMGLVGNVKTFLIYFSMLMVGAMSYKFLGGFRGLANSFPAYPWLSFFGRGFSKDLAAVLAVLVGVLSTQTYFQAIFSAKNVRVSKIGLFISGALVPPIGLAASLVGMYMRSIFPNINSYDALPIFIIEYLPDFFGGIALATLLISAIGTGAGLVLGVSSMFMNDIYKKYINPYSTDKRKLLISRLSVIFISFLTLFFVLNSQDSLILEWSFLSMGLRGATICIPLLVAVFYKNVSKKAGLLAIILSPLVTILAIVLKISFIEPLFLGLVTGALIFLLSSLWAKKKKFNL